jgi:hypothetical protein
VCGLKLRELAEAMGMGDYRAVSIAIKRFEYRLSQNSLEHEQLKELLHLLNVDSAEKLSV